MASIDDDFGGVGLNDSSQNLVNDVDLATKEVSWIIDNLPVTVFRISSRLFVGN